MSKARSELEELLAALAASERLAVTAEVVLARARAAVSASEVMIAGLKRNQYGRSAKLLSQLELQFAELAADAAEDRVRAERKTVRVGAFARRKLVKKAFLEHLPRERVAVAATSTCSCCGSDCIVKMGKDSAEALEFIPRKWKVIQTVREKFICRTCEKFAQPRAPFHSIPRGWADSSLLAMIVFEKYDQHQPLNRQAERYAREGVDLSLSTLADQVGAVSELQKPLNSLIETHAFAAAQLHGDDTTVPLLARGDMKTARLCAYVRDGRPLNGTAPPAVVFRFSPDRAGEHPREHLAVWQGIFRTHAYAGYDHLYHAARQPGPVISARGWSHARRKFFELADVQTNIRKGKSPKAIWPTAVEGGKRIDALFEIERLGNSQSPEARPVMRQRQSAPLVVDLECGLRSERTRLSKHAKLHRLCRLAGGHRRYGARGACRDDRVVWARLRHRGRRDRPYPPEVRTPRQ